MNVARLLLLPWWAAPTLTRGLIGVLIALMTLGFIGAVMLAHHDAHYFYSLWCAINLVAWALLMPNAMVLARDSRMLRLPALERDSVLSLVVYAISLVVIPGLLVVVTDLDTTQTILSLAIFAAMPMAYMCLPGYIAAFIVFGWLFFKHLSPILAMPIGSMDFTLWAVPALLALLLAIAWSWRRTVRGAIAATSYSAPMVLKLRMSAWKGSGKADITLLRQRPDWLRAQPDMRRCGPEYPQKSIRMALGGLFLPQPWISRLRNVTVAVLWSSLFVAYMGAQAWSEHPNGSWVAPLHAVLLAALVCGSGFGATMVPLMCLLRLGRVWQNTTGDLPLLALLPGLGTRGNLLQALLVPPLYSQLALLALSLICALGLHLRAAARAFILLAQFGAAGLVVVFALLIAAGKLPNRWILAALGCVAFVLVSISLFVPALSDTNTIRPDNGNFADWLSAGWIALGVVLIWLGIRGWRGFVQRPHPFLPNEN